MNVGTLKEMLSEKEQVKVVYETESSEAISRDGLTRRSAEVSVMEMERRGQSEVVTAVQPEGMKQQEWMAKGLKR